MYVYLEQDLVRVDTTNFLRWNRAKMDVKDAQVATAQQQLRESVVKTVDSPEEGRQYIITKILTTTCPKPGCGQVFDRFEGCASLRCSNENCWVLGVNKKTNFCAWCGKEWGNDEEVHRHIIYCLMNPTPGQYYPDGDTQADKLETYLRVLRKRQRDEIKQYLRSQKESVGLEMIRQILVACQGDFRACGIDEIEYNRV